MELGLDYKLESPILSYLLPPAQLYLLKVPKPPKIAPATNLLCKTFAIAKILSLAPPRDFFPLRWP